jgi:DNA-binding transcriptional ArsR family regulator
MDALGDPTRREVFERLRRGPRSVGEIARGLPVSQPAVSQHLRILREAGLVSHRREGARHIYRAERQGLEALREFVERFWDEALNAYSEAVKEPGRGREEGRHGG